MKKYMFVNVWLPGKVDEQNGVCPNNRQQLHPGLKSYVFAYITKGINESGRNVIIKQYMNVGSMDV